MPIPSHIIDEVRQSNNIVEIASRYLTLKKVGRNYKCLCPFHVEKTPSFIISSDKQIYHCFGCGEGGNVINFVMKIENMGFFDAVEKLAKIAGITLPPRGKYDPQQSREFKKKEQLYQLNEYARDFYCEFLKKSSSAKVARDYLRVRKITTDAIDRFKLGYAPPMKDAFLKKATTHGFSHQLLHEAGLVIFSEKRNRYYDRFYGRIIFPITDTQGRIIAFGGRVLDETLPKYMNSPDTLLFHKGMNLFGIDIAKRNLSEDGIIVLEGYTDVLMCHSNNIKNVVATLGTALTDNHIRLLRRYTNKVILVFDADKAGEDATMRGLERFVGSGIKVNVACLPSGEDPDSVICKQGKDKFLQIVKQSLSLIEYRLLKAFQRRNIETIEGKVEVIDEILPLLNRMTNLVEQREYIKKIAQSLDISEETLILELGKIKEGRKEKVRLQESLAPSTERGYFNAQRELVQIMVNYPEEISRVVETLEPNNFDDKYLCQIVEAIYHQYSRDKKLNPASLMDEVNDTEASQIIAQFFFQPRQYDEPAQITESLIQKIKKCHLMRKHRKLEEELKILLDKGDKIESSKIDEYHRLTRYLKGSR